MRMQKRRKIKKYRTLYSSRRRGRSKALKVLGFLALVVVVGLAGYLLAGPVLGLIGGNTPSGSSSGSSESSLSPDSSSEESSSQPESSSEPEPEETDAGLRAVTLPFETASDPAALAAFLTEAKEDGATAVVLELKDTAGNLLYRSSVRQAEEYGAVAENALDAGAVAEAVRKGGLVPVAKLSAFMDRTAPNNMRDNGYFYRNTASAWWDNSPAKGGKPWLNPYKEAACGYLLALQDELVDKGFEVILWHKVEFPEVWSYASANMGPESAGVSRQEALDRFIARSEEAAEAKGAEAFISYPVSAVFGPSEVWYDGAPTGLSAKNAAPLLDLGSFDGRLTIGETKVDFSDDETAVTQIMSAYLAQAKSAKRVLPVVDDPALLPGALKAFETLEIAEYAAP